MKSFLRSLCRGASIVCVLPILATHFLVSRIGSADASLETHSQLLSWIPGLTGSYLRVAFHRFTLQRCDPSATIAFGTLFSKVGARIHQNVYIGPRCMIGLVTLEEDTLLGPMVQIPSGPNTHGIDRLDIPIRSQPGNPQRITIGRDCWIGGGAIVMANVDEQAVIGAGSVVTRPVKARSIAAGSPARIIRARSEIFDEDEETREDSSPLSS